MKLIQYVHIIVLHICISIIIIPECCEFVSHCEGLRSSKDSPSVPPSRVPMSGIPWNTGASGTWPSALLYLKTNMKLFYYVRFPIERFLIVKQTMNFTTNLFLKAVSLTNQRCYSNCWILKDIMEISQICINQWILMLSLWPR